MCINRLHNVGHFFFASQVFLNNIELQPITIPDYRLSLVDFSHDNDEEKAKKSEREKEKERRKRVKATSHSSFLSPLKQIDITIFYSLHKFSLYTVPS